MANTRLELPVPEAALEATNGREVLRLWTTDSGERVILRIDGLEPAAWGLMLVDVARHVAHAYGRQGRFSLNDAFAEVVTMFIAEIQEPTDQVRPVDES